MKNIHIAVICSIFLTGCVGVALESAQITKATAIRSEYMEAALAGNPDAQYKVGKSYCCAPRNDVDAFYNNRKATEFLCKAARQHHAKAAFALGKIYSGDTIEGIRLLRRAATAVRGDDLEKKVIAYYWFNQAAINGYSAAEEKMEILGVQDISQFTSPVTAPCTITEVFGEKKT